MSDGVKAGRLSAGGVNRRVAASVVNHGKRGQGHWKVVRKRQCTTRKQTQNGLSGQASHWSNKDKNVLKSPIKSD